MQPLFEKVYPTIHHINLWDDIEDERHEHRRQGNMPCPEGAADWTIHIKFPTIRTGDYPYHGSAFLVQKLDDISRFKLPKPFVVIQHDTPFNDTQRDERRFSQEDWGHVIERLQREKRYGVVLDSAGAEDPPTHPRIISLINQTNLGESIELLKAAVGYYGIASCLSVIACQRFDRDNLLIKAHGVHYYLNLDIYCAPHKCYPFAIQHFIPRPPKIKVADARDEDRVEVLLKRGRVLETDGLTARQWVAQGIAICWAERVEDIMENARRFVAAI